MNIFRINNKYVAVAIFLMLAVTLQAQDYGALQYMLQKRPANEKFESNKFNEHLFFSFFIFMSVTVNHNLRFF